MNKSLISLSTDAYTVFFIQVQCQHKEVVWLMYSGNIKTIFLHRDVPGSGLQLPRPPNRFHSHLMWPDALLTSRQSQQFPVDRTEDEILPRPNVLRESLRMNLDRRSEHVPEGVLARG